MDWKELLKKYWKIIIGLIIFIYLIIPKPCGVYYPEHHLSEGEFDSNCAGLIFGLPQILKNPTYDTSIPAYCIGICYP